MNNNKRKIDISVRLLFVAASLIVLFFLWYFFIYVNGQEKLQIRKDFRALTQIGENFEKRYDSYSSVIDSKYLRETIKPEVKDLIEKKIEKQIHPVLNYLQKEVASKRKNNIYKYLYDNRKNLKLEGYNDSLKLYKHLRSEYYKLDVNPDYVSNFRIFTDVNKTYIDSFKLGKIKLDTVKLKQIINPLNIEVRRLFSGLEIANDSALNDYIYFSGDKLPLNLTLSLKAGSLWYELEKKDTIHYFRMRKSTFFLPIERRDTFEKMFIAISHGDTNKLFYSSFPGDLELNNIDSLLKSSGGISSGIVTDAKISGIGYKLFLTGITLKNGNKYYIGGLINKDDYVKEIRAINYYLVLILGILFIIFLLCIPLFKLKMTGENQELKISDLVWSALSIFLGTSFLLLVILSTLGYFRTMDKVNSSLQTLSDSLKNNFTDEINRIDRTLDLFISKSLIIRGKLDLKNTPVILEHDPDNPFTKVDTVAILSNSTYIGFNDTTKLRLDDPSIEKIINRGNQVYKIYYKSKAFNPDSIQFIISDKSTYSRYGLSNAYIKLPDSAYRYFKLVFNLDSNGDQNDIITSRITEEHKENYSYRRYFKESGEWELNGNKVMLDFVFSSTSGEQLGVVSKRRGDSVYVITSRLYSVINTILPEGYGFGVIDKNGDVKFHSDPEKMLQENILTETENCSQLINSLYSNDKAFFSSKYLGKTHSFYIQPIKELPLYLVTFYDNSYSNSVNIQTTGNIVLFLNALLIMFLILVISFSLTNYKKSELKRSFDLAGFLKPNKFKAKIYKKIIITNLVAVILIVTSCWLTNSITVIYLTYLSIVIQLTAVFFGTESGNRRNISIRSYSNGFLFIPGLIVILIYYLAVRVEANIVYLSIVSIILSAANYSILSVPVKKKIKNFFNIDNFSPSLFYNYMFSWLLLVVAVPVTVFFILFYNYETELDMAHTLFSYSKNEEARKYEIDKFYHNEIKESFQFFRRDRENRGIYLLSNVYHPRNKTATIFNFEGDYDRSQSDVMNSIDKALSNIWQSHESKESTDTFKKNSLNNVINYFRAGVDPLSRERRSLVKQGSRDIFIQPSGLVFVKHKMHQIHYSAANDSPFVYYIGKAPNFGFNSPEVFILFIIAIIPLLIFIRKIIQFISDRMFDLSIEEEERLFSDSLEYRIITGNNIIIQPSLLYEKILKDYANKNSFKAIDYYSTDPLEFTVKSENESKIIIINLDPDFGRAEEEGEKLAEIRKIGEREDCQVLLVMDRGIEKLIEICNSKIKSEKYEYKLNPLKKLQAILTKMDRDYEHLYAPLIGVENREIKTYLQEELNIKDVQGKELLSEEVKEITINELSTLGIPADTIKNYANQIKIYLLQNSIRENLLDKIILMVQENAKSYYEKIWGTCTNEEKLVLVDISDNLLLNDKNRKVIRTLLTKGFLKKDVSIDIVNKSFRNFVNTKAEEEEEEEKEYLKVRKTGSWTRYRAPLLLILFAVAFFIVLQENILSNIYSIMTVILGIMTVITKMSGLVSTGGLFKSSGGEAG